MICADCLKTKTEHPKTKEQESCCDRCVPEWCPAEEVIDAQATAVQVIPLAPIIAELIDVLQDAREAKLGELFTKIDSNGNGELEVA